MIRLPPRSTRTDTLFPYTTLFRSVGVDIDRDLLPRPHAFKLRFLEVGFDPRAFGVDDADHRQARHHVTADVRYFAGDAVDRRAHFGAFEIQLGLVQGGQRRLVSRSEERRVGKEWGSTCRSRWSPNP